MHPQRLLTSKCMVGQEAAAPFLIRIVIFFLEILNNAFTEGRQALISHYIISLCVPCSSCCNHGDQEAKDDIVHSTSK